MEVEKLCFGQWLRCVWCSPFEPSTRWPVVTLDCDTSVIPSLQLCCSRRDQNCGGTRIGPDYIGSRWMGMSRRVIARVATLAQGVPTVKVT